jgi:enoyl-CoA hydratase/carnithine racemase
MERGISGTRIRYAKKDHVGCVEIVDPCTCGAELFALADELRDIRNQVQSDEDIRVLLFSGFEEINILMDSDSPEDHLKGGLEMVGLIRQPGSEVAGFDCPTIAVIKGNISGPAVEVTLSCDLRIAAETASFAFPHLQAGGIPCDGGTQRLPRLVGSAKALELILTACTISAREALQIGLVNRVVKSEDLQETFERIAREMASRGPIALRFAKEAVYKGMDLTIGDGLRLESDLYFLLHTTRDRSEGIKAFQAKRKPEFRGE